MKIRALEIIQARPRKEEDDRQQHLNVQHTESVKVDEDQASTDQAEAEDAEKRTPKIPSSSSKRKGKKRVNIADKLKGLPVIKTTVLIPEEVKAHPDQWEGDFLGTGS